jgi:hypothetical protein
MDSNRSSCAIPVSRFPFPVAAFPFILLLMSRLVLLLALTACASPPKTPEPPMTRPDALAPLVETYVKLTLATGLHDPAFVDAYYGPPEWRAEVERERPGLDAIRGGAEALAAQLAATPAPPGDELAAQRLRYLQKHVRAMLARLDLVAGKKLPFDEEARLLYDAVAPRVPEARFEETLARLERLAPGPGPLLARIDALRDALIIPRDKLEAVFNAAIRECRARTVKHIALPAEESFTVEYVTGKPWGAYNWYQGNYRSVIQVNTDLPIFIDRAIDLACHEGYPGHHVMGVLVEQRLVRGRGFQELTVLPLYSPVALVAEGSANYGIELAFPDGERAAFEREVLVPLAGLDPRRAATWAEVAALMKELKHATNQAARRYLDGEIDGEAAAAYLTRYSLAQPDRARKLVTFIDANRSYVINYNLGEDLVRAAIARRAPEPAQRWKEFERLITSPITAGDL